ncbi:magnesium/cobalt transporter CorA [Macrococcus brunensis]|uniref:magnesium/cobalt transporter CorA n=1 Tax=Macrococcus brunensis TaxID=198483 RepID=UPI001EEFC9FA|nr:magnesium/cobalt transporter CorA [Macrococcus brunensis]ULG72469.1 magnesium/cobalt transporter CorA [Macrococcus brunensis]ULG74723.1 magnesium/cobalt transporter CorA [Macrococcus brunensis]
MIRTLYIDINNELKTCESPYEMTSEPRLVWVDMSEPTMHENLLLSQFFHFHPLSIEDAVSVRQRPKYKEYDDYLFYVFHAIDLKTMKPEEIDVFINDILVVTYHKEHSEEVDKVWNMMINKKDNSKASTSEIMFLTLDAIVDNYFPFVYELEDKVFSFEDRHSVDISTEVLIEETFDLREDLLLIRRTVLPMRDLVYRLLEGRIMPLSKKQKIFLHHINDHLIKQVEMIESSREMTADIRDNYISLNSFKMNNIMKILTIYSVIFMPLTLLAGIYGMNFDVMPELHWKYGYLGVWVVMLVITFGMIVYFRQKNWF